MSSQHWQHLKLRNTMPFYLSVKPLASIIAPIEY